MYLSLLFEAKQMFWLLLASFLYALLHLTGGQVETSQTILVQLNAAPKRIELK